MEFLVDILVEIVLGVCGEGFVNLTTSFLPVDNLSKKAKTVLYTIFGLIGMAIFVMIIVGIFLLLESNGASVLGRVFIGVSAAYVAAATVLKIISNRKEKKKDGEE